MTHEYFNICEHRVLEDISSVEKLQSNVSIISFRIHLNWTSKLCQVICETNFCVIRICAHQYKFFNFIFNINREKSCLENNRLCNFPRHANDRSHDLDAADWTHVLNVLISAFKFFW